MREIKKKTYNCCFEGIWLLRLLTLVISNSYPHLYIYYTTYKMQAVKISAMSIYTLGVE